MLFGCQSTFIPSSVTSIDEFAFYGCRGLANIVIPSSVTSIGKSTFYNCSGLTSVVVEEGNKFYDSRENCNAIIETKTNELLFGCQSTVIPDSVTSIGEGAFSGCSGLTSVIIPYSVREIGEGAFYNCSGLTSIVVEEGNEFYDSRENCNAIIEIVSNKLLSGCKNTVIPSSVTDIGDDAFGGCSGLTNVVIPDSVTSIGEYTFGNCIGLTSIVIPSSVTEIDECAFEGCTNLKCIKVPAKEADYYKKRLPEELHYLIVEMEF